MMKLSELASIVNGELRGNDTEFPTITIDSRKIKSGELFFAVKGENFDGHDFIKDIADRAAGAVVNRPISTMLPTVEVADTLQALGKIAAYQRQQFAIPVIAVTGSCGKTTSKAMMASILQQCGNTLATEGTLNNAIGVPLTLLKLTAQHRYAVIELGANHLGEIAYITQLTRPTIAMVLNAIPSHLIGFGDVQGVAHAKGEIFQGLAANGTAIINADDPFADYWQSLVQDRSIIYFGLQRQADISAHTIHLDSNGRASFMLITPQGEIAIQLPIMGQHQVMNALAAAAATLAAGASLTAIQQGLANMTNADKRLVERAGKHGATLIDDSYNANSVQSVAVAVDVLALRTGEKIVVLGDMGELSEQAAHYHQLLGELLRQRGVDKLYAYGDFSRLTVEAFGTNAYHFDDKSALIAAVLPALNDNTTVLIKGSRAMRMEQVVTALIKD